MPHPQQKNLEGCASNQYLRKEAGLIIIRLITQGIKLNIDLAKPKSGAPGLGCPAAIMLAMITMTKYSEALPMP